MAMTAKDVIATSNNAGEGDNGDIDTPWDE